MPGRVIAYDGASYREQLNKKDVRKLIPVVTLVLYFGMKRWNQPRSLKKLFEDVPKELMSYVNDYKIHVFEIAWLTDEEINRFTGDFRVVANFFAMKRRTGGKYIPDDPQEIMHVDAVLKLLSAMTGDQEYEKLLYTGDKGGVRNMCEVAQRLLSQGKAQGIKEGDYQRGKDDIDKLADYFKKNDPKLTKKAAREMAEKILN